MKQNFREYIHSLRTQKGFTLTKLASALDIDQSTLSKIENGKRNIPKEILPKLAKIFKLNVDQLENEFISEKIAEMIYPKENTSELLKLAEKKAHYKKLRNLSQGKIGY
ncbi:helix-turn-helix domain-containing protein [Aestuariivivens insulae]|uniref:helix-turn-helix domain-containing protein n=1 Tax=Aestuariivivens insulae TaxID=1621988 RepID=UPI001F5AC35E|nr:helix-turn-helix transcriptional regulator [Aestuariivivens insulae]